MVNLEQLLEQLIDEAYWFGWATEAGEHTEAARMSEKVDKIKELILKEFG